MTIWKKRVRRNESKMEKSNMGNSGGAAIFAASAFYRIFSEKCLSIKLFDKAGR